MPKTDPKLKTLFKLLDNSPSNNDLFNPWKDVDTEHEISDDGPRIRREQLAQYLTQRLGKARYLLVGEAPGYQGGHFSGIPMTSERLLLGGLEKRNVRPEHAFTGLEPRRTSKPEIRDNGFSEPTCTIVWSRIIETNIDPYTIIIWNSCPWHTYSPQKGMLSNRTPRTSETLAGAEAFRELLKITDIPHILAVGKRAQVLLRKLDIEVPSVRHPASHGAKKFRKQFADWYNERS